MDEEDNNSVNFFENLIKKLIDCINNIGENIKNFQIKLKRLPHVDMNQSKPMEEIAPKLPKDQLNELLQFEKDISSKFTFLTGLLTNKVELPDKLFNTLTFLHIKFIDLINSNQYYLEQNICGEILTLAISLYKDKSSEFINTKLKYVDPLLKLSISMIDNVKIDLKTYLLDIFIFTEKIICDSTILSVDDDFAKIISEIPTNSKKRINQVMLLSHRLKEFADALHQLTNENNILQTELKKAKEENNVLVNLNEKIKQPYEYLLIQMQKKDDLISHLSSMNEDLNKKIKTLLEYNSSLEKKASELESDIKTILTNRKKIDDLDYIVKSYIAQEKEYQYKKKHHIK